MAVALDQVAHLLVGIWNGNISLSVAVSSQCPGVASMLEGIITVFHWSRASIQAFAPIRNDLLSSGGG